MDELSAERVDPRVEEAMAEADPLSAYYHQCLTLAREWADSGGSQLARERSIDEVAEHLPEPPEQVPLEVNVLATVVAQFTDVGSESKLLEFRTGMSEILELLPSSPLNAEAAPGDAPWYEKDFFQLMTELMLFSDLADSQTEILAAVVWSCVVYGRDSSSIVALLASSRRHPAFQWGRAENIDETTWLCETVVKGICRSEDYLASEHVGEATLAELVDGL
eukprot:m.151059 g.151059  ORF g.151059 m.151059 type:complete len:221 (-) comp23347_c0_seq2:118-780(-)